LEKSDRVQISENAPQLRQRAVYGSSRRGHPAGGEAELSGPYKPWTAGRIARLGFLVGRGWKTGQLAAEFSVSPNNLHRQAGRFGLKLSGYGEHEILPPQFVALARRLRQNPAELGKRLLAILAEEPVLMANLLDDR
jgi:hypothetical protein